jgi:hypothetical protein
MIQCPSRNFSRYDKNDDDAIEAEIINDKTTGIDQGQNKGTSSWNIGAALSNGFNKVKEMVGMDEKSIQIRRERKRIDTEIDNALRGTGW